MHIPVLLQETIQSLKPKGTVIDATLGLGGHARAILQESKASLIGIDQDGEALEKARENLSEFKGRVRFVHSNFSEIRKIAENENVLGKVDGILMDLGVSSLQLDSAERGFSFLNEGPLDMRMNKQSELTAYEIVNSWSQKDIADTIYEFGEERLSRRIAKAIVEARRKKKIETTTELAEIIKKAVPAKYAHAKIHPATRTFQALRIAVNSELASLKKVISDSLDVVSRGGRIAVISFHSLEDRIVKRFFRERAKEGELEIITKKPIVPTEAEMKENPRSRSAKLRAAKKI